MSVRLHQRFHSRPTFLHNTLTLPSSSVQKCWSTAAPMGKAPSSNSETWSIVRRHSQSYSHLRWTLFSACRHQRDPSVIPTSPSEHPRNSIWAMCFPSFRPDLPSFRSPTSLHACPYCGELYPHPHSDKPSTLGRRCSQVWSRKVDWPRANQAVRQ